jgi:phosphopantothenoylcysteine decarboxylase/phosphopantothenate--cysteine ligase
LADINVVFDKVKEVLNPKTPLSGKKVVITAGGTRENIDPVRYIGNYSPVIP